MLTITNDYHEVGMGMRDIGIIANGHLGPYVSGASCLASFCLSSMVDDDPWRLSKHLRVTSLQLHQLLVSYI